MIFNFKDLKNKNTNSSTKYTPVPEGTYDFRIESAEIVEGSKSPSIKVSLEIISEGKYKARKVFHFLSTSEAATIYLFNFLKATKSNLIEKDDVEAGDILFDIRGKAVRALCTIKKFPDGKETNTLSKFEALSAEPDSMFGI